MASPEVVLYAPDKGAGYGQAFRTRGIARAWESLNAFFTGVTLSSPPESIRLVAHRATKWDDEDVAAACIDRARKRWGQPDLQEDTGGTAWPSGEPQKGGFLEWHLGPEQLTAGVEYLIQGEPWPRQTLGPVSLHFSVEFVWRDPLTGAELEGQRGVHASTSGDLVSSVLVTLSQRSFIQPELWFPFPEGSPRLAAFVSLVEPRLPFKLLPRHFRCAVPLQAGRGYRMRKLVVPPMIAA